MLNALAVGSGGFIGAVLRYLMTILINRVNTGSFPVATLVINILGSFLIGLLTQVVPSLYPNNKKLLLFLTTGILGGFTTFSTFSLDTVNLYQNGNTAFAILNVVLSVVFCLTGVILGKILAKVIVNS
ncbi:MAG: CrcB protein [Eubacterium sp.]|jgi:CrcB protein|nr:CrcB protein [Eubacterium sp.]